MFDLVYLFMLLLVLCYIVELVQALRAPCTLYCYVTVLQLTCTLWNRVYSVSLKAFKFRENLRTSSGNVTNRLV